MREIRQIIVAVDMSPNSSDRDLIRASSPTEGPSQHALRAQLIEMARRELNNSSANGEDLHALKTVKKDRTGASKLVEPIPEQAHSGPLGDLTYGIRLQLPWFGLRRNYRDMYSTRLLL